MRRCTYLVILIALAGAWGCASTGPFSRARVIHGEVAVSAAARSRSGPASLSDAIVYVEKIPAPPSSGGRTPRPQPAPPAAATAPTQEIVAKGDVFSPRVLAVVAGTRVSFRNADRVYHSTFSVSRAKHFDLGTYAPGQRRTVTFDRPGVVELFCSLHPETAGFVIVLPNPIFARADAAGTFALAALPPGEYTVKVWHPRYGERKATVALTGAADADVKLTF